MTKLLIKLFIKNADRPQEPHVREKFGILSGGVGVFCNICLTVLKFVMGTVTNSIAITADALNNLSDAASCTVTIFGFKASNKPADDEHPFGHGRIEYICALVVSFLILLMGFELGKTSVEKIFTPEAVTFSPAAVAVLAASMLVKIWMSFFNRKLGKIIDSPALKASATDSLSDTVSTGVTLVSLIISTKTGVNVDGYIGTVVALFIIWAGIGILKDTIGPLLGQTPSKELVEEIEATILSYDEIIGVHDLIIHSYGANRNFASAHAEVPSNIDIMKAHDTIDNIEHTIKRKFNIDISIHMDPLVVDDERINDLRDKVTQAVKAIDEKLNIHDFRVVDGPTHTNLIFDLVRPHRFEMKDPELATMVRLKVKDSIGENFFCVITVECSYI